MAKEKDTSKVAPEAPPTYQEPEGYIDLVQRYAQYDPGLDVRERRNLGMKGPPLHGLMVGHRELPATIADKDGVLQPWNVIVLELLDPAPVKDPYVQGQDPASRMRLAHPGEHIIITSTIAINNIRERTQLDLAINDPTRIYPLWLLPVVSQTKKGLSLWVFEKFKVGPPRERTARQQLNPFSDIQRAAQVLTAAPAARGLPAKAPGAAPALPEGQQGANAPAQAAPSRNPVAAS